MCTQQACRSAPYSVLPVMSVAAGSEAVCANASPALDTESDAVDLIGLSIWWFIGCRGKNTHGPHGLSVYKWYKLTRSTRKRELWQALIIKQLQLLTHTNVTMRCTVWIRANELVYHPGVNVYVLVDKDKQEPRGDTKANNVLPRYKVRSPLHSLNST